MVKSSIVYMASVRRCFRRSYYESLFADFLASGVFVSEFPPCSERNFGHDPSWIRVSRDVAKNHRGYVFFKNASLFGRSCYYVQKTFLDNLKESKMKRSKNCKM